ncbi:hypothetical protein D9611_012240 [Ephemerocybe angulata]|uniref:Uncharacterized protein n=1 Tax=Ephemerocybe angulata TaxID=980116 RepID=A0A8H5AT71_9AGAR|nr:hypothetical protein D9611_012240 [Tulosesus angulatus]
MSSSLTSSHDDPTAARPSASAPPTPASAPQVGSPLRPRPSAHPPRFSSATSSANACSSEGSQKDYQVHRKGSV